VLAKGNDLDMNQADAYDSERHPSEMRDLHQGELYDWMGGGFSVHSTWEFVKYFLRRITLHAMILTLTVRESSSVRTFVHCQVTTGLTSASVTTNTVETPSCESQ
jgi:hypothetical protein